MEGNNAEGKNREEKNVEGNNAEENNREEKNVEGNNTEENNVAAGSGSLAENLAAIDQSLIFLILILASVLLSFYTVTVQKRQLIELEGNPAAALPDVLPMKTTAGALVVGALGYFFELALKNYHTAQGEEGTRSARTNLWASLFVFLASLLRFGELYQSRQLTPAEQDADTLPN